MYSFFVLGIIPGTNFQITFQLWMEVVTLLVLVWAWHGLHREHRKHANPIPLRIRLMLYVSLLHLRLVLRRSQPAL